MSFKPLSCHFNPLSCALPGVDRVNSGIFPFPQHICMLNFMHVYLHFIVGLPNRRQPPVAHWFANSCAVMVLSLDSLGQCVSALSKRFVAAESVRDSSVSCLPPSHRDKHSEVRHRKDAQHQQDDTPKPKVAFTPAGTFLTWIQGARLQELCSPWLFAVNVWGVLIRTICLMQATNSKIPTSILKRPSPVYGSDIEPNHRRKGERRVRFREPETTVHGENTGLCWTFYSQTSLFSHTETTLFM